MPNCKNKIETLRFDSNEIVVNMSELNFTVFNSIKIIQIYNNYNIYGTIHWDNFPSSLQILFLAYNDIESMDDCNNVGTVCGMDKLYNLYYLNVGGNELSGTINWQMFANASSLDILELGYECIAINICCYI